jgi:cytochrome P450
VSFMVELMISEHQNWASSACSTYFCTQISSGKCRIIKRLSRSRRKYKTTSDRYDERNVEIIIQNYQIIERKKCERGQRAGFDEAPQKKIFLDYLLDLTDQDDRWRDEESVKEARTIVVAGSDATALSVCYVLMMLAMHQEIQVGQLKSNCTLVMTLF